MDNLQILEKFIRYQILNIDRGMFLGGESRDTLVKQRTYNIVLEKIRSMRFATEIPIEETIDNLSNDLVMDHLIITMRNDAWIIIQKNEQFKKLLEDGIPISRLEEHFNNAWYKHITLQENE